MARWLAVGIAVAACGGGPPESTPDDAPAAAAAARALAVADAYVEGYFAQFPEEAYEVGYPDAPADRWSDRSSAALAAWRAQENGWLATLRGIDPADLAGTGAAIPYAYALDRLEAAVDRRVCRMELWNVSPTWTGWPELVPTVLGQQPVGTEAERRALLARVADLPRYLDTEVANLREGARLGFTAPGSNVDAVVAQVDALLATPLADSPFVEPAGRAGDEAFGDSLAALVEAEVVPAARRYRDFLADEYRDRARTAIGVAANPDGSACYAASVRYHTTLPLSADEIHRSGLAEMERIGAEMRTIGRSLFGVDDPREALARAREPAFTFRSEAEILAYAEAAVDRARAAMPRWFGFVPDAEVVVRPYPAFQRRTGGGFYSAGPPGEPGVYQLGTYEPARLSRAGLEATAFHETWPGHHMQVQTVLATGGAHPVLKYFYNSGMGEGWALYSERLADEMGLYGGEIDRLGMLANEALRAARLVVDPGMHELGWSRERAVEYMRANTAEPDAAIAYELDRYLAVPGQATAYLTGSLEIRRLREAAAERLGDRFDVRAFHDRVLANGTVTLPMLAVEVERWVVEREEASRP